MGDSQLIKLKNDRHLCFAGRLPRLDLQPRSPHLLHLVLMASMDDGVILESLDSLWFFSNILSPSPPTTRVNENTREAPIKEPQKPKRASPSTHQSLKPQHEGPPVTCLPTVEARAGSEERKKSEACEAPRCINKSMEQGRKRSNTEQSTKRTRRFCKDINEVQEFMGLGLGFQKSERELRLVYTVVEKQRTARAFGLQSLVRSRHYHDMPPLSDGLAMKEHLRSWAHAVACTVG